MSNKFLLNGKMSLIVSLPKNNFDYAKAAWESGADAIKIHVNANHFASGTKFYNMEKEWPVIKEILEKSPVPVGIVIGDNQDDIIKDFDNIMKQSFSFISVYFDHATLEILNQDKLMKTVAIRQGLGKADFQSLEKIGVEALELSILDHAEYGKYLTVEDLMLYKKVVDSTNLPTILPTQKKIRIEDLEFLKKIGINALMIGAVVTGVDLNGFETKVQEFANAIKNVNQ